ncbi:cysteine hydrolase family protein [Salipiger marinus]|uniref:Nicotinamidase-related amidase n=1 Tax=Salipiger marinus TaxID=555512 RepID=A0A1G8M4M6_9RHOB|nr:isochorismatase family cysteine hydrolase [Salipiger marinus]SDI62906.1 Nicotinamidase-related amidase [Salipiger marinus]
MTRRIWEDFITERDGKVFAAAGYGVRGTLPARPALLLVGFNRGNLAAIPSATAALAAVQPLVAAARAQGLPVIHATGATRADGWDRPQEDGRPAGADPLNDTDFAEALSPAPTDIVIRRQAPSAFFDSDLMSFLNLLGVDGLVVAGGASAGALRATVIDAFSLNLRVAIAEDACFDAWEASHAMALCDLHAKYADPLPAADLADWIATLPAAMFALPKGCADRRPDLMPGSRR